MAAFIPAVFSFWRKMRKMGGPKRMYYFYRKVFKRNQIAVIMGLVILVMAFLILNLSVKLDKVKGKPPDIVIEYEDCKISNTPILEFVINDDGKPDQPKPLKNEEKVILPSVRRYARDRLQTLEHESKESDG